MNDNENKTNAPIKLPDLLPCPFCGGNASLFAELQEDDTDNDLGYSVHCRNGCVQTPTSINKLATVERWNKRAALNEADALRAEVEGYRELNEMKKSL